ncbi:MAG: hypothetical protein KBC81_02475 [Candidatus Pacebacteria bacterium]|nr:hypothetical protein [Candidatus Paceibacterota bacterium]
MKNIARVLSHLALAALMVLTFDACGHNPNPNVPDPIPTVAPIVMSPSGTVPVFTGATQVFTVSGGDEKTYSSTVSPSNGGSAVQQGKTIVLTAGTTAGTFSLTVSSGDKTVTVAFTVVVVRTNSVTFVSSDPAPSNTPITAATFVANYTTAEDGLKMRVLFYGSNGSLVGSNNLNNPVLGASGQVSIQAAASTGATDFLDFVIYREGVGEIQHFRYQMHYVWGK